MRRRSLVRLGAASLLLAAAVGGIWVASYGWFSGIWHVRADGVTTIVLRHGGLTVVFDDDDTPAEERWEVWWLEPVSEGERRWVPAGGVMGFRYRNVSGVAAGSFPPWREWTVPLWPGVVGFGGMGGWLIRRGRRKVQGVCGWCGYDLRATPERCPECGREAG